MPTWELHPADLIAPPAKTDSNTPFFWHEGTLYQFSSHGRPERSQGPAFGKTSNTLDCTWDGPPETTWWIEAVWYDAEAGVLCGWYHFEPFHVVPGTHLTAPWVGAVVSSDLGVTWRDLGPVITNPYPINPSDDNGYFCGGTGDFHVVLDQQKEFFWFFISTYAGPIEMQGIAVSRSPFADRGRPGTAVNMHEGRWDQPGLGGYFTPLITGTTGWHGPTQFDCPWGPSVHWNTYLEQYVMLLNRTTKHGWMGDSYEICFSHDLENWTAPEVFYRDPSGEVPWYPSIVGDAPDGTDTLCGKSGRFCTAAHSRWRVEFER